MKRYLFFITKPYSLSVIEPLFTEVNRTKRGESLVFLPEELKLYVDPELPAVTSITAAIRFNPDVVFVPGNIVHDRIPGLKVQIFHGLCEEKGGHYKITGFFDLYCTSGPLIHRKFSALAQKHKHFMVAQTGWPKADNILAPYNREEKCRQLGLDAAKRIVLYAPTFSPKFKSSETILPVIESLPAENEIWILKFHDLMDPGDINRVAELKKKNILRYHHPDIVPLLQAADVLISDTSSVVYEFMLLDKPVITLNARVRPEKGINVTSAAELRTAVNRSLADPGEFSAERARVLDEIHPYKDRKNSERVLNVTDEVLSSGVKGELKKKPLNLYRKFQVRKRWGLWL